MKPTHDYSIEQRKLYVFDDFASSTQLRALSATFAEAAFGRREHDIDSDSDWSSFSRDLRLDTFSENQFARDVAAAVSDYFPALRAPKLYRAYINLGLFGDMYVAHRDADPEETSVTALLYANDVWDWTWAGETLFFDDVENARAAVNPKPGRLALFDGAILHRTGNVARCCYQSRFTIALKYVASEAVRAA